MNTRNSWRHRSYIVLVALAVLSWAIAPALAQDPQWDSEFGNPGLIEDRANALAATQEKTDVGPGLFVGGFFTKADRKDAHGVAKYDKNGWSDLDGGLETRCEGGLCIGVYSLAIASSGSSIGPALYAGGNFLTNHNGLKDLPFIAKWDGIRWSKLQDGGMDEYVSALAVVDDGEGNILYAGGNFWEAGGEAANFVAQWNGTKWSPMGDGTNNIVHVLLAPSAGGFKDLYAGGDFSQAGGKDVNHIASWNGSTWSDLDGGMNEGASVYAMTMYDDGQGDALYVGGFFNKAGSKSANNIAKWDGDAWSKLRGGVEFEVRGLAVLNDVLYVAGIGQGSMAAWDGVNAKWLEYKSEVYGEIFALAQFNDKTEVGKALYVAGGFDEIGSLPCEVENIARWGPDVTGGCEPSLCHYKLKKNSKKRKGCKTCPKKGDIIVSEFECFELGECPKKLKIAQIPCPGGGEGFCKKIKGKRDSCGG